MCGIAYYDLAAVYAFLGDKGKAYENLSEFKIKSIFVHGGCLTILKLIHSLTASGMNLSFRR